MAPQAFSTGSGGNNDDNNDKKDKKGGEDSNKFKYWKKENEKHDDDNEEHDKVKVCHVPPGNEGNAHTIEISESALASHLEHGDVLGACPDDEEEENPAYIIFIRAITDDNGKTYNIDDFTISIDGAVQDLGLPILVEPNTEKTITGFVPEGYKFVLISGDPACPVNIDSDTFTLKKGQTIVCTIYYDDLFVPGGSEGADPTVKVTVKVNGLPGVVPEQFTYTIGANTGVANGDDPVSIPKNVAVEFSQTNFIDDVDGIVLPTSIQGDGNCPEIIGTGGTEIGYITLGANQNIECIVVYGEEIKPGVIFHYDSVKFDLVDNTFGDNCFKGSSTISVKPCFTKDIDTGNFLVVPNLDSASGQVLRASTVVLFTVIGIDQANNAIPNPDASSACVFDGLKTVDLVIDTLGNTEPHTAFQLACPNTQDDPDDMFRLNFALIETLMPGEVL
jgi:hypothetical protein